MMREILFRGKTQKTGKWVEGYLIKGERTYIATCKAVKYMVVSLMYMASLELVEVIPETVGQFTGKTDKKRKKIFEGDIVKDCFGRIMEVVVSANIFKFQFRLIKSEKIWANNFVYADMGDWFNFGESPVVIGNIHDNPELLEVE